METNLKIWLGRTAYQLMPDRFYKAGTQSEKHINDRKLKEWNDRMPDWKPDNDGEYRNMYYYGGNLKGIEEKLDYLKDLGFDMIYITPIEQSASYHHYDVGDHNQIDPWLGTWEDLKSLCQKAKKMNILIVADLVFNHTGITSKYYSDPKYQTWYKKTQSGKQIFWWGFKDMPECDTMNSEYQDAMTKVVEKYLENGVSGIRLDLGENLPKEFLFAIERVREKYPKTIFIGEMWGIATDKQDAKIFDGQLNSVMNYPVTDAILRWTRWGVKDHFSYNYNRVFGEYPQNVSNVLLNNIATHDTPTTMTMLAGDKMNGDVFGKKIWDIESPWLQGEKFNTYKFREYEAEHDQMTDEQYTLAKRLSKVALAIMYTIPGIPCVYAGTEVGDTGYKDPFNRKPYLWDNQDEDMKEFVKKLGKYRKENADILSEGTSRILQIDESIIMLERSVTNGDGQKQRLIAVFNRTEDRKEIEIPDLSENAKVVFEINHSRIKEIKQYGIVIVRD